MSIFGESYPKIYDVDNTTDIDLKYSVIIKDEPENKIYGVKSVRTGQRVLTNAGRHWIYEIKYYLYKETDPKSFYETLKDLVGKTLYLYRRSDGNAIKTGASETPFTLTEIREFYTDINNLYDCLMLTFRSLERVDTL